MTNEELIAFEFTVRKFGYSTTKERGRYCQGVVNSMYDTWIAAKNYYK